MNCTCGSPKNYDKIREELIDYLGEEIVGKLEKMNQLDEKL